MGRRGPAPTPAALKQAMGRSLRADLGEPQPDLTIPPKPPFLDAVASAEWDRMSVELHRLGLLSNIDGAQLELYCVWYSRLQQASKGLNETGMLIKGSRGQYVINPLLKIASDATEKLQQCISRFGMNPADRTRIKVDPPSLGLNENVDDFYEHIGNPKNFRNGTEENE